MGSPAQFAKLANNLASQRKSLLVPFNLFNAVDNLSFVANDIGTQELTQALFTPGVSPALSIDTSLADVLTIVITTHNYTSSHLNYQGGNSPPIGQRCWLRFVQVGSGHTVATPNNLVHPSGFVISSAIGNATVIPVLWTGSIWVCFENPFITQLP